MSRTKQVAIGASSVALLLCFFYYLGDYMMKPPLKGGPLEFVRPFSESLWIVRSIDVLLVIILIFAGVLAIVGLTMGRPAKREVVKGSR